MGYNQHTFQNLGGRYQFTDYVHFLEGIPTSFEGELPIVDDPREFRQTLFGAYVQGDWKMKSNLTINVGLRYEMTSVLNDAQGRITNLVNITDSSPVCATLFTAPVPPQPGSSCGIVGPYYSTQGWKDFCSRRLWNLRCLAIAGYFLLQQNQAAPFLIFKSIHGESNLNTQPGFTSPFQPDEGGVQLTYWQSSNFSASARWRAPERSPL